MAAKIVDNNRIKLAEALKQAAPGFSKISIATGYWDLPGFQLLKDALAGYDSIRIIIGQEPLPPAYTKNLNLGDLEETFPERQMRDSLAALEHSDELRESAKVLRDWIKQGKVEVKIFRGGFLHAKAYIFGDFSSPDAVGVIGSSNFTGAGLTRNLELNALEDDVLRVMFRPQSDAQPHGHLSWFNSIWDDPKSEKWDGKFTQILESSPMGDLTFSQYHMYVKALYEIYSDELVEDSDQQGDLEQILYSFQLRNAKLLLNKLERNGVAMLADSVGLGKTITAGGVLKTYLEERDANRVYIIAPASLTGQWASELAEAFKLVSGFEIISMQDAAKIKQARELDKYAPVDLFIVDEAHNLRSGAGSRFDDLLDWFSDNPESHVLLLTATPINNSLKDLKNQIQLGAKGKLQSFAVVYPTQDKIEVIDFYEAIDRLNAEVKRAITAGKEPDYDKVNNVMRQGLRHFMVRTTRKGIEKEFGGVMTHDGKLLKFPRAEVVPQGYKFSHDLVAELISLTKNNASSFEGHSVSKLNVNWLLNLTQRAEHPMDTVATDKGAFTIHEATTPFEVIFQCLLLLGFSPYKPDIYKAKYHRKDVNVIKGSLSSPEEKFQIASQLSIHNMLRVTFLKRLESSQFALKTSLESYKTRIEQFSNILATGYIARVKDMNVLLEIFGEASNEAASVETADLEGFELKPADPKIYDIEALKNDLRRDLNIIEVLLQMCKMLEKNDDKLEAFATLLNNLAGKGKSGNKVLVFSYYADTISYLRAKLPGMVQVHNFSNRAEFTVGKTKSQVNDLAKRFSPKSKKASEGLMAQGELDFLFATDVLSEGQNLQDCGLIVNFDLHWNPVRMIQRNGRINRLGSSYDSVKIYNMHPDDNLNQYLSLVERLQRKIEQIKYAVGTDQSILGEDANPMEFVDLYDSEKATDVAADFEDDGDLLTEDEFVNDLREFDATASADEKKLVQEIGLGKWGYLPEHAIQHLGKIESLTLVKVSGVYEHTGQVFKNFLFVKRTVSFGPVETYKALSALRVSSNASARKVDHIDIDRNLAAKRSRQLAKVHAQKNASYFRFTPTVNLALDALAKKNPEIDLAGAFRKIQTRQTEKRGRALVRSLNVILKSRNELPEASLNDVRDFINYMGRYAVPSLNFSEDSIQGVLHFAS